MSHSGDGGFAQGRACNRPPMFCGDNFNHWKALMKIFIIDQDMDLWTVITTGPYNFEATDEDGKKTLKTHTSQFSATELEKIAKNYKAMNVLYCALSGEEFNRVSNCKTAKEIWDKLVVTYEGTSQVKQTKINLLHRQYELFKMKPEESIKEMFKRFTEICNNMESLGKVFTNEEKVRKILRSLPKTKWEPKTTAIEEAQDLSTLDLDDLQGKLLTHEMTMKDQEEDTSSGIKNLVLKARQNDINSEDSDELDDDAYALLSKALAKILRKRNSGNRDFNRGSSSKEYRSPNRDHKGKYSSNSSKPKVMNCFECGDADHLVRDCPKKRKSKSNSRKDNDKNKKAMVATWSDSDSSSESESEGEQANLCLMAGQTLESDKQVDYMVRDLLSNSSSSIPEILKSFLLNEESYRTEIEGLKAKVHEQAKQNIDLIIENQELEVSNKRSEEEIKALKASNIKALKDSDVKALEASNIKALKGKDIIQDTDTTEKYISLKKHSEELEKQNASLTEQLLDSRRMLSRFAGSDHNLRLMLGRNPYSVHKSGIGYNARFPVKSQTIFVKASRGNSPKCFYCGKIGHVRQTCPFRRNDPHTLRNSYPYRLKGQVKQIWVQKGIRPINLSDPEYDSKFYTWSNSPLRH